MRGKMEYVSDVKGECADDIQIDSLHDEREVKFVKWARELEDIITHARQSVYDCRQITHLYYCDKHFFNRYNTMFTYMWYNLCVAITMDLGKLYASGNGLCLSKFNEYLQNNCAGIFGSLITKDKQIFPSKNLESLYENKIKTLRNKMYGHADKELLSREDIDPEVDAVLFDDLDRLIDAAADFLSDIWEKYNGHKMCFEVKGKDEFQRAVAILKQQWENDQNPR